MTRIPTSATSASGRRAESESTMWPSSRRGTRTAARGFSLVELLVALAIFSVVIAVPMYLLFTMRNYAEKQQYTIVPRQAARRAVEYISQYVEGAADLNAPPNPGELG